MPKILDACCGSRLFWFDKDCSFATYMDIREEEYEIHGKKINVKPDVVADFRDMPFENNVYDLVVFDPPHLKWAGQNSIMKGQYGQLDKENWPEDIKQGMSECMRVLKPSGTLIFKWNENQVKLKDVLKAVEPYSPLFGNKRSQTHWLVFMKEEQQKPVLPEFVAKWFEDAKDNLEIPIFYECVRAMEICKEYRNEFHQWFANSKKNPIETLIRMKDGYEVEKEPMYYVILSENKGGWKYTFLDEEGNADYTNNKAHIPTFTEKEIKGNDERFWPFAVPVKEVEG